MRMQISRIVLSGMMSLFGVAPAFAAPPKVIIDTDFNTIFDDGQVASICLSLQARAAMWCLY
jgi:hypothetical protein